jgi:NhaP-type Na+/H+ and K+/H+ antiporter
VIRDSGDHRALAIVCAISGVLVIATTSNLPLWLALVVSIAIGAVVGLAVGLVICVWRRRRSDQPVANGTDARRGASGGADAL